MLYTPSNKYKTLSLLTLVKAFVREYGFSKLPSPFPFGEAKIELL